MPADSVPCSVSSCPLRTKSTRASVKPQKLKVTFNRRNKSKSSARPSKASKFGQATVPARKMPPQASSAKAVNSKNARPKLSNFPVIPVEKVAAKVEEDSADKPDIPPAAADTNPRLPIAGKASSLGIRRMQLEAASKARKAASVDTNPRLPVVGKAYSLSIRRVQLETVAKFLNEHLPVRRPKPQAVPAQEVSEPQAVPPPLSAVSSEYRPVSPSFSPLKPVNLVEVYPGGRNRKRERAPSPSYTPESSDSESPSPVPQSSGKCTCVKCTGNILQASSSSEESGSDSDVEIVEEKQSSMPAGRA